MDSIVTTAIALIRGPRSWGTGTDGTLSDLAGAALVRASPTKLPSQQFEELRSSILKTLRQPAR
jgi:hypothetical protein